MKFGPFSLTKLFLQNWIFMKHYFFTFSAISHELSKLQSSTIWQNKHLYLTNLIYFMIHDKKMTENRLNRAIYQLQICLYTLYFFKKKTYKRNILSPSFQLASRMSGDKFWLFLAIFGDFLKLNILAVVHVHTWPISNSSLR